MTQLLPLCERYVARRGHWTRSALQKAARHAPGSELAAAAAVLVDSGGLSAPAAARLLGVTPERAGQLLQSSRVEDELRVAACPGWPLVRGGLSLTDEERSAGDAHAEWCAECRARRAERDLRRRQLAAAGSATTVTATGSAVLVSALTTKAAVVTIAAITAVGGGVAVASRAQAPAGRQPHPAPSQAPAAVPTAAVQTSRSAHLVVAPTPGRAPLTPGAVTPSAPVLTRPTSVVPIVPTLPVVLPTQLPTVPLPTLPVTVPTTLPTTLPTLLPR